VRLILRILSGFFLCVVLVYAGDFLAARFRIPSNRQTLDSVQVQTFWAITQKDGRIDYEIGDADTETCIHSLFPQLGYTPCWYLTRHTKKIVKVG
jgi:hypothetical protein